MSNAKPASIESCLQAARDCLQYESKALAALESRLNGDFSNVVELIRNHPGKVVTCGVGKSGLIAQKVASTLCSTGTPAVFLHAAEAQHGDLGIYQPGDPTLLFSKSGSTAELVFLLPILKEFKSPIIAIVGNTRSEIARQADFVLDGSVCREADPLGLVPTSSALVALAWGDALASALMVANHFRGEDFVRFHPAGQLGKNLSLNVRDVMRKADEVAWISAETTLREIVMAMSRHPQGACCVVDENHRLIGLITDGDIRRLLEKVDDFREIRAHQFMTRNPLTIRDDAPLAEALRLMEDRPSQISVLPVIDSEQGQCIGLLRIHDAYQPHWRK